jgi:hypothetical protein
VCAIIAVQNIDLPATMAHIHLGTAGTNGPIVVNLPPPGINGISSGCVKITRSLATVIKKNPAFYYVNVHTLLFPDGAVRGQLHP